MRLWIKEVDIEEQNLPSMSKMGPDPDMSVIYYDIMSELPFYEWDNGDDFDRIILVPKNRRLRKSFHERVGKHFRHRFYILTNDTLVTVFDRLNLPETHRAYYYLKYGRE